MLLDGARVMDRELGEGERVMLRGEFDGAGVMFRGEEDGERAIERGLGELFIVWLRGLLARGETTLISEGPPRTNGRELAREGALMRLGALRVIEGEPMERGLLFGALVTRDRLGAERGLDDRGEADRLLIRGADRVLIRGADRLAALGALPREAAARLDPFDRDCAAASGAVMTSDTAAMSAAKIEVHERFDWAADMVSSPSQWLAGGAEARRPDNPMPFIKWWSNPNRMTSRIYTTRHRPKRLAC